MILFWVEEPEETVGPGRQQHPQIFPTFDLLQIGTYIKKRKRADLRTVTKKMFDIF